MLQAHCIPASSSLCIVPRTMITFISRCSSSILSSLQWRSKEMIDHPGTWVVSQSCVHGETLHCGPSVNKQHESLLEAAKGMLHWLWQLSPQGGGLNHKLTERSHMIGEFHLEPSRYIKPHRNEEFTEVPIYSPRSPQITCMIVTLCPLPAHLLSPHSLKLLGKALPILIRVTTTCRLLVTFTVAPFVCIVNKIHLRFSWNTDNLCNMLCNIFSVKSSTEESRESYTF